MTSLSRAADRRRRAAALAGRSFRTLCCLAAVAWQPTHAADEDPASPFRSPAEIYDQVERSKIQYVIKVSDPDEAFLTQLSEPPRDSTDRPRLVDRDGATELTRWICSEAAENLLSEAEVAFGNGDMETAQTGYRSAVASDSDCYVAHSHLGDTFLRTDNETMALAHYSRAIELNPKDHKTYAYRGHAYLRTGEAGLALADFQEALALRPHYWLVAALLENYPSAPLQFADARLLAPVRVKRAKRRVIEVEVFDTSTSWIAYGICAAAWRGEGFGALVDERALEPKALRKRRKNNARERDEEGVRFELALERECMAIALQVYLDSREDPENELFAIDPAFEALEKATRNDFFDEALLYGVASQRLAQTMLLLGEPARKSMLEYVQELVLTAR